MDTYLVHPLVLDTHNTVYYDRQLPMLLGQSVPANVDNLLPD